MLSLVGDVGFCLDMSTHVSRVMLFASRVRAIYIYIYIYLYFYMPHVAAYKILRICTFFFCDMDGRLGSEEDDTHTHVSCMWYMISCDWDAVSSCNQFKRLLPFTIKNAGVETEAPDSISKIGAFLDSCRSLWHSMCARWILTAHFAHQRRWNSAWQHKTQKLAATVIIVAHWNPGISLHLLNL